jgi:dienelactone hydrolase
MPIFVIRHSDLACRAVPCRPEEEMRNLALTVAVVALLSTGCGGRPTSSTATGTPPHAPTLAADTPDVISTCADASPGWRRLRVSSLNAAAIGNGRDAVVFLNETGNDSCPWVTLAQRIAGRGYRVAVFEYRSVEAAGEPRAVRDALAVAAAATKPGGRSALVGASLGGRVVFEAAARDPVRITAIVSLSGERTVLDYRDILPAARRVRAALLYIGSREDGLTEGARQPRQLRRAVRSKVNQIVLAPGAQHGTDLLFGDEGKRTASRIEAFVAAQLG